MIWGPSGSVMAGTNPKIFSSTVFCFCLIYSPGNFAETQVIVLSERSVWDYDTGMKNDFIGYIEISVAELEEKCAKKEPIALKPPPKPHNQDAGSILVKSIAFYDPATTEGKVSRRMRLFMCDRIRV